MDEKSIRIIPFSGKKGKWNMWLAKFMARSGIRGYDILLKGDGETPADNAEETKNNGVTATLKLLNKKSYNKLILAQKDTIC